jgi:hypothetical protein
MKNLLLRSTAIIFSILFLAASVGVIMWISQDEKARLADREAAALEQARLMEEAEKRAVQEAPSPSVSDRDTAQRSLENITILLSSIESDDLPSDDEN